MRPTVKLLMGLIRICWAEPRVTKQDAARKHPAIYSLKKKEAPATIAARKHPAIYSLKKKEAPATIDLFEKKKRNNQI
jgi:hypothetical protein